MTFLKGYFNDKGMTLIEIMMAIAVMGIFFLTCSNIYRFISVYNTETLDQLRMTELAQSEIERIKYQVHSSSNNISLSDDNNKSYPSPASPEQKYSVNYTPNTVTDGDVLKVNIGAGLLNLDFATWLPNPELPIIALAATEMPEDLFTVDSDGNLTGWVTQPDSNPTKWETAEDEDALHNKIQGGGNEPIIYYEANPPFNTFNYIVKLEITEDNIGNNEFCGIIVLDATDIDNYYDFGLSQSHHNDYLKSTESGSEILVSDIQIKVKDYSYNFQVNDVYYLQAIGDGSAITFNFGENLVNGQITPVIAQYIVNDSGFYPSEDQVGFYLGIHDSSSQTLVYYSFDSMSRTVLPSGEDSCNY